MRPICIFKTETKDQSKPFTIRQGSLETPENDEEPTDSEETAQESRAIVSRLISRFETEFPTNKRSFPLSKSKSFSVKDKKKPVIEKRTQDDSLYNSVDENEKSPFHVRDLLSKFENFKASFKPSLKKREKSEEDIINERIEELEKNVHSQLAVFKSLYKGWDDNASELSKRLQRNPELEEKYTVRVESIIKNLNAELEALVRNKVADEGFDEVDGETEEIIAATINVKEIKTKFERQSSSSSDKQPPRSPTVNDSLQSANLITSYFNRLNGSTQQENGENESKEKPLKEDDETEVYALEANHVKHLANVFESKPNIFNNEESEEENAQTYEEKDNEEVQEEANDDTEQNQEIQYVESEGNEETVHDSGEERYIPYKDRMKTVNQEADARVIEAAQETPENSEEKGAEAGNETQNAIQNEENYPENPDNNQAENISASYENQTENVPVENKEDNITDSPEKYEEKRELQSSENEEAITVETGVEKIITDSPESQNTDGAETHENDRELKSFENEEGKAVVEIGEGKIITDNPESQNTDVSENFENENEDKTPEEPNDEGKEKTSNPHVKPAKESIAKYDTKDHEIPGISEETVKQKNEEFITAEQNNFS